MDSTLVVTPRGLTTGVVPSGSGAFQIDFDFVARELAVVTSGGGKAAIPLRSISVAHFYREMLESLGRLGVPDPHIVAVPNEVAAAVPFPEDVESRPYERDSARLFAAALVDQTSRPTTYYIHFDSGTTFFSIQYELSDGVLTVATDGFAIKPGPRWSPGFSPCAPSEHPCRRSTSRT